MQGGNTAGGLGLDKEFIESVMATQEMLYGFLGFHPTYDGFAIAPQLPKDWPELTITRIYLHDQILDITADAKNGLRIHGEGPADREIVVHGPADLHLTSASGVKARMAVAP
jgi:cellobiose phosphorylase